MARTIDQSTARNGESCCTCAFPFDRGDHCYRLENGEASCSRNCARLHHDGVISAAVHAKDTAFYVEPIKAGVGGRYVMGDLADAVIDAKGRCCTDSTAFNVFLNGLLIGLVTLRGFTRHIPRY